MIPTRTDDLRFASWPDDAVPAGFRAYRKISHDEDGLGEAALSALIGDLRAATPEHLQQEVCYGLWDGHPALFGGAVEISGGPARGRGFTGAVTSAARLGSRITAFGDRRRADTAAWADDLTHKRLELSGRRYLLFRGPLAPVTQWFRDRGPVAFRHAPDLIWPDDHSWIVTTPGAAAPAGQGFTVVGGSSELAAILDADPALHTA